MSTIEHNIATVRSRIEKACRASQRSEEEVLLLAVSKTKPAQLIREAFSSRLSDFGENYVQEAIEKMDTLADLSITWHYIGHIQTNKTRPLAERFAWVHTVDRLKVAQRLNEQRPTHLPALNICIEVNLDEEASKSGVTLAKLPELAHQIAQLPRLRLRGLMAIPMPCDDYAQQVRRFRLLHQALNELRKEWPDLDTLSMGMSSDLEAAITAGSTIVRVGTDIFGARDYPAKQPV